MRNSMALRVGTVILVLVAGGVVGACSNSSSTPTASAACAAQARLLDAVAALPTGGPTSPPADAATIKKDFPPVGRAIDALDKALPNPPSSLTKVLTTLRTLGTTGDASVMDNLDTTAVDSYFYAKCQGIGAERAITAKEYEYDGGTAPIPAGVLRVQMRNGGQQVHEMLVLRVKDGSTPSKASLEALVGQGQQALSTKLDFVNATLAPPGQTGYLTTSLAKGSYVMLCTIPVGTTSMAQLQSGGSAGPPHATQGMIRTFTVN